MYGETLKLFPATVANAVIGSLKSLHTLFDKYLDHMLVKFEQDCMVQTTRNLELFDKKPGFFKGTQMGPLLVLACPCFRENVNVTCKIVPFLCSLDNFFLKKCNRFLFWKSNFKMALI